MEQMVQGAPDAGAQTPVSDPTQQGAPPETTPAQQFAANQPQPPQGQQPPLQAETEAQEQYFLKAETGSVYKTAEAAAAGIAEKDRFIQKLLAERSSFQQPQQAPQPVDPKESVNAAIAEIQMDIYRDLRSDPDYQQFSDDQLRSEAKIQARSVYQGEQRATSAFQKQLQSYQHEQFVRNTPELNTPIAQEVYDAALRNGHKFKTPQEHLKWVHAEMYARGIPHSQPQAGYDQGVQGAMQNQQRPIFSQPTGSGAAPQAQGALSPLVQRQVDFAIKQGHTGEALERIKQRAIQSEAGFKR